MLSRMPYTHGLQRAENPQAAAKLSNNARQSCA